MAQASKSLASERMKVPKNLLLFSFLSALVMLNFLSRIQNKNKSQRTKSQDIKFERTVSAGTGAATAASLSNNVYKKVAKFCRKTFRKMFSNVVLNIYSEITK